MQPPKRQEIDFFTVSPDYLKQQYINAVKYVIDQHQQEKDVFLEDILTDDEILEYFDSDVSAEDVIQELRFVDNVEEEFEEDPDLEEE